MGLFDPPTTSYEAWAVEFFQFLQLILCKVEKDRKILPCWFRFFLCDPNRTMYEYDSPPKIMKIYGNIMNTAHYLTYKKKSVIWSLMRGWKNISFSVEVIC